MVRPSKALYSGINAVEREKACEAKDAQRRQLDSSHDGVPFCNEE